MNEDRILATHPGNILGLDTAEISDVAAAIRLGVGVDDLAPESILGTPFNHFLVLTAEAFEVSLVILPKRRQCGVGVQTSSDLNKAHRKHYPRQRER